jgi:hypothetical protein
MIITVSILFKIIENKLLITECFVVNKFSLICFIFSKRQKDTSFLDFIACEEMKNLRDRIVWIHVNLPGQEVNAEDINVE